MHSVHGKKEGEGRNSEQYSALTFINNRNLKFLEQTGTPVMPGYFSSYSPKANVRDLIENYFLMVFLLVGETGLVHKLQIFNEAPNLFAFMFSP